ncbi:lysophospholipid acyltransferase family protein [Daejeonella lutea]|uniref:KDO2-lipid IV(A) lauroyltransferase n=1 Tax=Daejeonella lutea TaxID=572036 RepID=A0A1T5AHB2_9SPHI|nr:lysophospholipid acyltransferase family protein [Daejeonella lutea]SKB34285.1 KDO2-lipid IV(A) lauroyltransferase [Daejeonella lutea]
MNKVLFGLVSILLKLISLLPFWLLYLISDLLFILLYHVFKYRRKVVHNNLANSFPNRSAAERAGIEKRFYKFLADMIMESTKSISITKKELQQRYQFENLEAISRHLEAGRSVIAVSGHYGNWEWGPLGIPSELDRDVLVVYKPLSDTKFDQLITKVRARFGTIMVPMKQTLRKITEYKNTPHVLVLVGDQTPVREESQYFTDFLNQPTAVFLGVEKIASKTNSPVVYFSIKRIKRGHYKSVVEPLIENPNDCSEYEITTAHTKKLEDLIEKQPDYWLWSHKRWKFKPEDIKK